MATKRFTEKDIILYLKEHKDCYNLIDYFEEKDLLDIMYKYEMSFAVKAIIKARIIRAALNGNITGTISQLILCNDFDYNVKKEKQKEKSDDVISFDFQT